MSSTYRKVINGKSYRKMKVAFFSLLYVSTNLLTSQNVTTFAGSPSGAGSANGIGTAANFYYPTGIGCDPSGNVFVGDYGNHNIRKITPGANVTTFAGTPGASGFANGGGAASRFSYPHGVTTDNAGNVYVADYSNNAIRKISPVGVVTTLAGNGTAGSTDGVGSTARFYAPRDVAVDVAGNVYVTDYGNNMIRKITPAGVVTTVAGTVTAGNLDGVGTAARFNQPSGIAISSSGDIFVSDHANHQIRKITPAGVVTTFVGNGTAGNVTGTGTAARFFYPWGLEFSLSGDLYVADYYNHQIKKITPAGKVSLFAGTGAAGTTNGPALTVANFIYPSDVAIDMATGNMYIADRFGQTIRGILSAVSPLPIELLYFEGKCNENNVILYWSVASQTNNNYFNVEKSDDGINFTTIKTITGAGTTSQKMTYSIQDEITNNNVIHYYRLSQTDYNGQKTYFNIIDVNCIEKEFSNIRIYPNPNNGNFIIDGIENAKIVIYNSLGQIINENYTAYQTNNININNLPVGIYHIQIQNHDIIKMIKVLVQPN